MLRFRMSALALVMALASLAFVGCKKEGGEVTKEAGAALTYMPAGTKMVFGVNVSKLASADVLAKYKDQLLASAPKDFKELQTACGIDIFKDISSVVVGMAGENKVAIVVSGNFTKDKVESCLKKAAEKDGKQFSAADEGKLRVYTGGGAGDKKLYAYWAGEHTVVMSPDEAGGAVVLNDVVEGKKLADDSSAMKMVKATKTGSGLWAAGNLDPSMTGGMPVGKLDGFALTVEASDTLDIKVLANFASEDDANQANQGLQMGLTMAQGSPMAKPFLPIIQKVKIELDGKSVKAGVSLTGDDLDKLANLKKMMGGMMPM